MFSSYFQLPLHVSPFTIVTSVFVVLLGILYIYLKDKGLPPGPWGFPLVGYWPFLEHETIHFQFQKLKKKYGEVFSFTVGGKLFIHLGSIKAIKEAHLTKSDCFTQRYDDYSILTIAFGKGIAVVNGDEWKILRKFFVQAFKEYGLTSLKDYMAESIYDSVNDTTQALMATKGETVNIIPVLNARSLAIFRRMMFNDNEVTEKEIQNILDAYGKLFTIFSGKNGLLIGDFSKKYLYPRLKCYEESIESSKVMREYLSKIVKRHEETYSDGNIRDVIDGYIRERKERKQKGDPSAEYFSDENLVGSLVEFVGDGILSIAIFIAYFIHELLEHPEEQEKIYKELIDVVGLDREVTLEDKNNLPYTNAFIQEVIRTTDIFTFIASLECTKETTINGYRIPVGAISVTNFWSSHRDPDVFEEPDSFKPSRYIAEPGKQKAESPVLFGVGKRSCAGESFTMMQVFLFLTAIIKNFKLKRPEGEVKKSFLDGQMDVCAYPRK